MNCEVTLFVGQRVFFLSFFLCFLFFGKGILLWEEKTLDWYDELKKLDHYWYQIKIGLFEFFAVEIGFYRKDNLRFVLI